MRHVVEEQSSQQKHSPQGVTFPRRMNARKEVWKAQEPDNPHEEESKAQNHRNRSYKLKKRNQINLVIRISLSYHSMLFYPHILTGKTFEHLKKIQNV